jgi:sigma-B regulation protein RsbU (phosphoserine phosphatase)
MPVHAKSRRSLFWTLPFLIAILGLGWGGTAAGFAQGPVRPAAFDLDRDRQPVVSVDGLWRFHPGDNSAWSNPTLDDSGWALIRSDEPWSDQGYPAMSGYGWYRFTVQIPAQSKACSLLLVPIYTSYEVYVDGHYAGTGGDMPPVLAPHAMFQFHQFPITEDGTAGASLRTVQIAIRVWHSKIWASYVGGGPSRAGSLAGESSLIASALRSRQYAQRFIFVDSYVYSIIGIVVGLTILGLFIFRPKEHEYLWCAILLLSLAVDSAFQIAYNIYGFFQVPVFDLLDGSLIAANIAAALAFFSIVLRAPRDTVWRITLGLALLSPLAVVLYWPGWLSVPASAALQLIFLFPSSIWVLAVLGRRAISRDMDALLLLVPTGLYIGYGFVYNVVMLLNQAGWMPVPDALLDPLPLPPFTMHWMILFDLIFLAALLAFLIRRFTLARQGEERYAGQLDAARQVQQVLLPDAVAEVPGFAVDCVYHPAEEVGGDFFQILPTDEDGLLIVMGDVAGKGLPAAMLVSVLVGAIRTEVAHTSDPGVILASLNERMCGRSQGGFTTCICLHMTAQGQVTAASAGHLAPYCDGAEVTLEPALPLGIVTHIRYETSAFTLTPGQRLTLVSDGVVEAQTARGELLGFDRTRQLSTRPATEIAAAAQEFGQTDDITVVTIAFRGNPATLDASLTPQALAT